MAKKFRVLGDARVAYDVTVEADTEQLAMQKVQGMSWEELQEHGTLDHGDTGLLVVVDVVEKEGGGFFW